MGEEPPTDEELAAACSAWMRVLADTVVEQTGVQRAHAFRLLSAALVKLDQEHAEQARVPVSASPLHDAALLAIDRLRASLAPMKVKSPQRLEGFSLLEAHGRALAALEHEVSTHGAMARGDMASQRPRLLLANGREAPASADAAMRASRPVSREDADRLFAELERQKENPGP